jgi:Tfp pilus assembly protein PilX
LGPRRRPAAALIVCLFVMSIVTTMVVAVIDTQYLQLTSIRNTADYERALYLAGAAVHHAIVELDNNIAWRTGIPSTEFPLGSGNTYSATVVDGAATEEAVVTGTGVSGAITRKLEVTVLGN